ncbi:hypothetical protein Scep_019854 [Stephania cephalantha]|uniref:Uncharacterized protein n=1 Tax=Stephania cephalantha TaxID=152367 RepID=A0AAP0IBY7_9MAGN
MWPEMHASLLSFKVRLQQMQELTNNLSNVSVAPSANAAYVKNPKQAQKRKDEEIMVV